ncbi:MAG: lysophospholipid acyltransferase family protein [Candidatus Sumerlaeota bacterium]|nr:lysophospholipid acyltransferase family protein [Candidatus Sumerlaeota bacterium]
MNADSQPSARFPLGAYFWYSFLRYSFLTTMGVSWRLCWRGVHNIPKEGPFILAPNHQSWLDPILAGLPVRHRMFHYMSNEKYYPIPLVGMVLRSVGVIPINLKARLDRRAYQSCLDALRAGHGLIVFPEGTRTRDGLPGEMKPGLARMALLTGAKIVPVGLTGAYDLWPRTSNLPHLTGRLMLKYYRPICVEQCESGPEIGDRAQEVTRQLERVLRRRVKADQRLKNRNNQTQHNLS